METREMNVSNCCGCGGDHKITVFYKEDGTMYFVCNGIEVLVEDDEE